MDIKYCFKTQIVDECNLNCRGCDHFAPIAKVWHQPVSDYINMIKTLKQTVGNNIKEIELYGGEPLLHEKFYEILLATEVVFPQDIIISVETNGILLDKFLQKNPRLLKDSRIEYQITEYLPTKGIVDRLNEKYPQLTIFRSKHTPLELDSNNHCWKDSMFNVNIRKEKISNVNPLEIYNNCYCKSFEEHSMCLRNWKLSPCPIVMCMDIFDNYFGEEYCEASNYVRLDNELCDENLDKIAHYPCENCKRCGNIVYGFPYQKSNKQRCEWQVTE